MSKIEWTDQTWNPITGCIKVSPGCKHCYAEGIANRFWKDRGFTEVHFHKERLDQLRRWKKSKMIFVCSMSDLFQERVSNATIWRIFNAMGIHSQHTYQVLTKRSYRMKELFYNREIPDHIWLGVSAENQQCYDERTFDLVHTGIGVKFVSVEPLLEPVDLHNLRDGIDWVIVGAESGPKARPMKEDWVRSIRDQCVKASVAFFYKQRMDKGKKISLPELDGKIWDQMPKKKNESFS